MKSITPLLVILGLVIAVVAAAFVQAPIVQRDVETRATRTLSSEGYRWANAAADGRDVVLRGSAPDEASKDRALEIARRVRGVRRVTSEIVVLAAAGDPIAICQNRVRDVLRERMVEFGSASAEIERASYSILDRILAILESCPEATVQIGGHTDNVGKPEDNRRLSQARAESIRDYLIGKGIPAARLKAVGFGQDHPLAPNDSEAGRARNRRIEFILWKGEA